MCFPATARGWSQGKEKESEREREREREEKNEGGHIKRADKNCRHEIAGEKCFFAVDR